ncbi:hypothetical protein EIP86_008430 [Pleurotus ostreatoroseus]|nr:hypothetical protein EIP86_008430 [Pleurotus ostreatoroseus]
MSSARKRKRKVQFQTVESVQTSISEVCNFTVSGRRIRRRRNVDNIIVTQASKETTPTDVHSQLPERQQWAEDRMPEEIDSEISGIKIRAETKTKRYDSTAYPLLIWLPHRTEYLLEYSRHDGPCGVGERCVVCEKEPSVAKCDDCDIDETLCMSCMLKRHRRNPLHFIKVWQGGFFVKKTLFELGLVVSLGHRGRTVCLKSVSRTLVIIHTNGIHKVNASFCDCQTSLEHRVQLMRQQWWPATSTDPRTCATFDVLRLFQHMNLQGHINAYDFYRSLENMTDAWHLEKLPDRLSSFMLIIRQYRNVKSLKRAGRMFEQGGVDATKPGQLAIPCRACPHPGKNLPEGWEKVPPEFAFLYWMFLAMDANFRQKNRHRPTTYKDVCLSPGWSYFVETEAYMSHVKNYASQEEISTCVGFMAMILANLKKARGLSATGVGGCCCARHDMWRPNGIGDLQRGERFCNMDYILLASIVHMCILLSLVVSYDIACQFFKNFWKRLETMPKALQLPLDPSRVKSKVPKGHLPTHVKECHAPFSFNYLAGAGRTCGEGIESNWSVLNKAAPSCKEMGPSARRETLDDFCGFHNWRKTIGLGDLLLRRMLEAMKNELVFRAEFDALNAVLSGKMPEQVASWAKMIKDWENNHELPCPYEKEESTLSLQQVRHALALEEEAALRTSSSTVSESSAATFLLTGLEIEKEQLKIRLESSSQRATNVLAETTKVERRNALRRKIKRFREVQGHHMATLRNHLPPLDDNIPAPPVHEEPLYLPSGLSQSVRTKVCEDNLLKVEERLREAECHEYLANLCGALSTRLVISNYKTKNAVGQRENTRSRQALQNINAKINQYKHEYRLSRTALLALRGPGKWEEDLRELRDEDVRTLNERALTQQEAYEHQQALRFTGASQDVDGVAVNAAVVAGDGSRSLSWIWLRAGSKHLAAVSDLAEGSDVFRDVNVDALRVKWSKCFARATRYREEIILVAEEMRRSIAYCEREAIAWVVRGQSLRKRSELSKDERDALIAYAMERAHHERALAAKWSAKWQVVRERAGTIRREMRARVPHWPQELDVLDEVDEELLDSADGSSSVEGEGNGAVDGNGNGNSRRKVNMSIINASTHDDNGQGGEPQGAMEFWVDVIVEEEEEDDDDDDGW